MAEVAQMSDIEVARCIEAEDRDVLRALIRRCNPMMYRAARSILRDDAEAEDAVQEAFILAYQRIDAYRGDAQLSTWLVRIVVNEAIARLRRLKRRAGIITTGVDSETAGELGSDGVADDLAAQPEAQAMRSEIRSLLEKSIDALPESFRIVFVLRAVEQMTVDETAAALDIPAATVRTRYFRARSMLRESLADESDFAAHGAFSFAGARCDRIVAAVLARVADRRDRLCPLNRV